ncbi:MAG TPA: nucleoside hydrolase [Verrucomicrobiae bacterium]
MHFTWAVVIAFVLLFTPVSHAQAPKSEPVKIIFDTDMDSDCDDVGALAMLHALADKGEIELLAVMTSAANQWSMPCVDAINTFFGRPDLPLGRYNGKVPATASKYARQIAERFPHDKGTGNGLMDAVLLYHKILNQHPDQSIVILSVGDLSNLAALLKFQPEGNQAKGEQLVKSKVREWVCMGGNFIGRPAKDDLKLGNNNFTLDKPSSHYAVTHWPGLITFVGREIGSVPSGLQAGKRLAELPKDNIVRAGYEYYFDGVVKSRHVADQTAVLYAARGLSNYWDVERRGYMDIQPDNTFVWNYEKDKHHYLLKRTVDGKPNDREIEKVIEDLMMYQPKKKQ